MHELALCRGIIEEVSAHITDAKVQKVVVEIGRLTIVLPEALRFSFDLCAQGTALEGATLEIREVPGKARCLDCQQEVTLERPFDRCSCGSSALLRLSGDELRIVEVEVLSCV